MTTLIESPASSAPIRLVFDANVLISAALTGAQAGYALTLVTEGTLRGIVSEPILAEVERKLTEKFQRTPAEVTQQLDSFRQILDVVKPVPVRSPTLRDQRDRRDGAGSRHAELGPLRARGWRHRRAVREPSRQSVSRVRVLGHLDLRRPRPLRAIAIAIGDS